MLFSLALIFIVGFFSAEIFRLIKLPRIIGMLLTGVIIGPFVLDLLDPTILGISPELRKIALIIILIKAGLSLNLSDLKKVGRPAVLMSFLPAVFEIAGYVIFAPLLLDITLSQAALMGAIPLSVGLDCGNIILSVAVVAIIITAPFENNLRTNKVREFLFYIKL